VVQVDAHLPVVIALVAECILNLGDAVVRRRVEVVLAHRLCCRAVEVDLVVIKNDLLPTHAVRSEGKALVLGVAAGDFVAADEVRHGLGAGRTEGVLGRLGRLEKYVRAAIAIKVICRLRGCVHVVAAGKVRLRDAHDGVAPRPLRGHEVVHRDRRHGGQGGRLLLVRKRRVVQVDAHLPVVIALVAECILNLGDAVVRRRVEVVLAHRLCCRAVEVDLVVIKNDLLPTHAVRSEGKALVLGVAAGDFVAADEVRHGLGAGRTEGVLGRLGRLEKYVRAAIAIKVICRLRGCVHVVAAGKVRLRDAHDGVAPRPLRGHELVHRDGLWGGHRCVCEGASNRAGNQRDRPEHAYGTCVEVRLRLWLWCRRDIVHRLLRCRLLLWC